MSKAEVANCNQEDCKILLIKEALDSAGIKHGCFCLPEKHWPNTEYKRDEVEPLGTISLTGKFKATLTITRAVGNRCHLK